MQEGLPQGPESGGRGSLGDFWAHQAPLGSIHRGICSLQTFPDSPLYSAGVAETSNQENKHHTQRVGELRFIKPVGPEELTLQALSPEQRGYRVFIDRLWWATLAVNRLV